MTARATVSSEQEAFRSSGKTVGQKKVSQRLSAAHDRDPSPKRSTPQQGETNGQTVLLKGTTGQLTEARKTQDLLQSTISHRDKLIVEQSNLIKKLASKDGMTNDEVVRQRKQLSSLTSRIEGQNQAIIKLTSA